MSARLTAEQLKTWDCPHCGSVNTAGRKTCGTCGAPRQGTAIGHSARRDAEPVSKAGQTTKPAQGAIGAVVGPLCKHGWTVAHCPLCAVTADEEAIAGKFGKCAHTGRKYRSKTEARWAAEHPEHRYEALAIATACGVYWVDFVGEYEVPVTDDPYDHRCNQTSAELRLIEVKGAYIRDRALHKAKAAIRPARALGFAGIWLAVWDGKRWDVKELEEG